MSRNCDQASSNDQMNASPLIASTHHWDQQSSLNKYNSYYPYTLVYNMALIKTKWETSLGCLAKW